MSLPRRIIPGIAVSLAMLVNQGCITVKIRRPVNNHAKGRPPMMADKDALAARVENLYKAVQSFIATVDMSPSVGSIYKGEITDYTDFRGYILFRKPADIRIQAQIPVVRTQAFDMVSNGSDFKLYMPTKSRFVVGRNDAPADSPNKLENLRPQAFMESLLVRPIDPSRETTQLIDISDEDHARYLLIVSGSDGKDNKIPLRSIWFDRTDLSIIKQEIYAPNSNIVSSTRYSEWTNYSGVMFPKSIEFNRPIDGYGVTLDVIEMKMNVPMTDKQFVLEQPPGSTLQVIGAPKDAPAPAKSQK